MPPVQKSARDGGAGDSLHVDHPNDHLVDATPATLRREKEAIAARVHGEHAAAFTATAGDPVLTSKLRKAIEHGMAPIPLGDTPAYRRPQVIDEALMAFERLQSPDSSGCAYCGTTTARSARGPFGLLDRPTPSWGTHGTRTACGWCVSFINENGEQQLAQTVFAAAVGLKGVGAETHLANLWYHLDPEEQAAAPKARLPWSHLDIDALRQFAKQNYFRISFADNPGARPRVPGIVPPLGPPGKAECLDAKAPSSAPITSGTKAERLAEDAARLKADHERRNAQDKARWEASGKASQTWSEEDLRIDAMRQDSRDRPADPQSAAEQRGKQKARESEQKLKKQLAAVTAPPKPGNLRKR